MEHNRTTLINIISNALMTAVKVMPALLLFEVCFKLLSELIFQPVLSGILQSALKISGYHIAFNGDIAGFFTNISGIIGGIIVCILAALLAYFEFAVIILMIYMRYQGFDVTLPEVMKQALTTFRSLKSFWTIGFFIYILGLTPLIGFGLAPAINPSSSIPNFITGELYKTVFGSILIVIAYIILYIIFFSLIFVLPAMVLRRTGFLKSCKVSLGLLHGMKLRQAIPLIIILLIWCVFFAYPGIIPTYYAGISDSSLAEILGNFFFAWKGLLQFLLVEALKICFSIIIFTFLTIIYVSGGGKVKLHQSETPNIDRSLRATQTIVSKTFTFIRNLCSATCTAIQRTAFYKKHKKPIWAVAIVLIFLIIFGSLYTQPLTYDQVVIGHRGSQSAPENTIEAVDGAISAGADYAEVDVMLSKDGIPMVIHDDNLKRLTGENVNVYDLTARELSKLTATQNDKSGKISTLNQMIDHCRGKIDLVIELKLHGHESRNLTAAVVEVIEDNHFQKNCKVMSIEYSLVEEFKKSYPEYPVGYCVYGNLGNAEFDALRQLNVDFLVIEESMASQSFISKCNKAWLPVYVWTVNTQESMESCLKQGAAGIITDKPKLARKVTDQYIQNSR